MSVNAATSDHAATRKAVRRPLTPAELAARRANAKHSTGPRTVEGKKATRGNALKHGFASAEPVVLPPELAAEVEQTIEQFLGALKPANAAEARQVRKAAVAAVRHEHLSMLELVAAHARKARAVADRRATIDATVAAALKRLEPIGSNHAHHAAALDTLARSAAGCAAVADQWSDLLTSLDGPDAWSEDNDARRAAILLGCPDMLASPDQLAPAWRRFWSDVSWAAARPSPRGVTPDEAERRAGWIAAARDRLRIIATSERDRWQSRADDLNTTVEPVEIAAAPILAAFDPSPEGSRLARYLADADRAERGALATLDRLRRLPSPLSTGFDDAPRNEAGASQSSPRKSFATILDETFRAAGIWPEDEPASDKPADARPAPDPEPTADPVPEPASAPPRNEAEIAQGEESTELAEADATPPAALPSPSDDLGEPRVAQAAFPPVLSGCEAGSLADEPPVPPGTGQSEGR